MPPESVTTGLAHGMRILRRQRALTLDALAELTGLTKSYLSKVERGLSTPSMATALKLALALVDRVRSVSWQANQYIAISHYVRKTASTNLSRACRVPRDA